jgi:hypothetical protein
MKRWKKINHPSGNQKEAGEAILALDKADFKQKLEEIKKVTTYQ